MTDLSRQQILSYRRRVSGLHERASHTKTSLERVAQSGLQDSMPRAALLSIHARVERTRPSAWNEPPFVQVWGPRYSAFVIAERDVAVFTLGRLPDTPRGQRRAFETADRLEAALEDREMDVREAARIVGLHPNALRYAAPTGRFLIHWDGARQPHIRSIPAPEVDESEARRELARRHVHTFGPSTPTSFESWAGVRARQAADVFDALSAELTPVTTPVGDAWILADDEPLFHAEETAHSTRLLPSGDTYYLLQGRDRELLVPDEARRARLWTSRVWPGAVLHDGEIVGTWRRSRHRVTVSPWQPLTERARAAIEKEAVALPLPGVEGLVSITWEE